jgi:hypothetical protein
VPDYRDQEARNETVFREMNEWTADDNHAGVGVLDRPMDVYLCECSDSGCTDPIRLTNPEYEAVRSVSVRFAIALNHENPEVDRLVFENERYATVDKFYGYGAEIARDTDPRRVAPR